MANPKKIKTEPLSATRRAAGKVVKAVSGANAEYKYLAKKADYVTADGKFSRVKKSNVSSAPVKRSNDGTVQKRLFQSSKEGLTMYKDGVAMALPKARRKAIRTISENLNTKAEGRDRKKIAKRQYADIKSTPKTDAEMRKQNAKKSKGAQVGKAGGGNNFCKSPSKF